MKRWMWMLVILFACGVANAQDSVMVAKKKSGTTCDSCSGDLALAHHFEDETCDDNTKSVCGCSDNASKDLTLGTGASLSTTTATGWPSDGSKSLAFGSTATSIPLTWDKTKGTISFDAYCSTMGAGNLAITIGTALHDGVYIYLVGTDDNNKVYGTIKYADTSFVEIASASNSFTGAKKTITFKWDTASTHTCNGNASSYVCLSVDGTEVNSTTQPTAPNGTYTSMSIGDNGTGTCYMDNLKIYTSWQ